MNYFLPVQMGAPDWTQIFRKIRNITTSKESSNLGPYLAGLWEGDGHVWIPTVEQISSGKNYNPHFVITFDDKQYPLVLKLKTLIGGNIRHKKDNHAYTLSITSITGLINIITLLNGFIRTPKLYKFNLLIDWVNNKSGSNFIKHEPDISNINSNAWFSGFTEADGSFDIRISLIETGAIKNRIAARYRLEQRITDPKTCQSYENVLNLIAFNFGISLSTSIHNKNIKYYLISISSSNSRLLLVNYFEKYPLFSSKLLNYNDWLTCHNMINSGDHLTESGRKKALLLKNGMNSKRTYYNWEHLDLLNSY